MDDPFQVAINGILARQETPKNWKPYPPGVIVTGYTFSGIFGIIGHRGHLFRVGKARQETNSNSGWNQNAHCLICDRDIGDFIDAEWWQRKATKADVMLCLQQIVEAEQHLARARAKLRKVVGS